MKKSSSSSPFTNSIYIAEKELLYTISTTYGAGMMSDCPQSYCSITAHHSICCIAFHYLVFHHCEFLCHLHRFLFMGKHTFAHFIDDHFATFNVLFGPTNLCLQPFNLRFLFILERHQLILVLNQIVASFSYFIELHLGSLLLFISLSKCLYLFRLRMLDLLLMIFLDITSGRLELIKFSLRVF